MIAIQLLEDTDIMMADDWCRPLNLRTMSPCSDYYSFKSCYDGRPENNVQWCKVIHAFGSGWIGKPIGDYSSRKNIIPYEFVRGNMPVKHQLDMRHYK
jgi:hypothetical protein